MSMTGAAPGTNRSHLLNTSATAPAALLPAGPLMPGILWFILKIADG